MSAATIRAKHLEMFGVPDIDAWWAATLATRPELTKESAAVSILSDAQEQLSMADHETTRKSINRAKWLICELQVVKWTYLSELPDEETSLLIAHEEGEVSEGYLDGGAWYYQHNPSVAGHGVKDVYAWAHIPAAPTKL